MPCSPPAVEHVSIDSLHSLLMAIRAFCERVTPLGDCHTWLTSSIYYPSWNRFTAYQ